MGNNYSLESLIRWRNKKPCFHNEDDYTIGKIRHTSVKSVPGETPLGLPFIMQTSGFINPNRHVIEICYDCDKCHDYGRITVELFPNGKKFSYGWYTMDCGEIQSIFPNKKFTVAKARAVYNRMDEDYRNYSASIFNISKEFAKEYLEMCYYNC
jgi:hypothetical protein